MHILLVEPKYYTKYPPLGLLKISSFFKQDGHTVELVRGCVLPIIKPDKVFVTSLFTYAWKPVHDAIRYYKALYPKVPVSLGGIYASLMPDHAKLCDPDLIHKGIMLEVENILPDYSLVQVLPWNWPKKSILFSSRGCIRRCKFCAVPQLEGKICQTLSSVRSLIHPDHDTVIFWDNNFLASPYWREILYELQNMYIRKNGQRYKLKVDFNQGLDGRLIKNEDIALELRKANVRPIRLAYDKKIHREAMGKAIKRLKSAGFSGRQIFVYTLYNFDDNPQDFWERVANLMEWGVTVYPMRFEPLDSLEKNQHIGPGWTKPHLEMVSQAQRVIGDRGAFTPFDAMREKLTNAKNFEEAFCLRPNNNKQLKLEWGN
jgi:hypothetical protein